MSLRPPPGNFPQRVYLTPPGGPGGYSRTQGHPNHRYLALARLVELRPELNSQLKKFADKGSKFIFQPRGPGSPPPPGVWSCFPSPLVPSVAKY